MATVGQLIEKNLAAIVGSGIIGLMSFVAGTTQTTGTIRDLTKRVEVLEQRTDASLKRHNCTDNHVDRLETKGPIPPCQIGGM